MTPQQVMAESDDVVRVLQEDGTLRPEHDPRLDKDEAVALLKAMVRTRQVDDKLVTLQRQGRIGFHIGSLGEEATIIGSAFALRSQDFIFPCYREFGAALLRGLPLQRYVDNMFGNANDPAKGRQMPDHYTGRSVGFGSISSPIGTQIAQAAGYAWAAKLRGDDVVTLVYFGEGATSSNDFHNGMNFAGVYHTPLVLLCRNNGWAISLPSQSQTASGSFAQKGQAYGVSFVTCDGNDVLAVVSCTRQAVARAAAGQGPTLIEALTYRMSGHSTSDDPNAYRAEGALQPWRERDPIHKLAAYLTQQGWWGESEMEAFQSQVDGEIREAIAHAEATPAPSLPSMFEQVYHQMPWHLREQQAQVLDGPRPNQHHTTSR